MKLPRRLAALAFTLAVAMTGCGGGDGTVNAGPPITDRPTESTTVAATATSVLDVAAQTTAPLQPASTQPEPPAGEPDVGAPVAEPPSGPSPVTVAQAEAAVLQASDLPEGWKAQGQGEGLEVEAMWNEVTRCVGLGGIEAPMAWAVSGGYVQSIATQVRTMVQYRSVGSAAEIGSALEGPALHQCALAQFTANLDRHLPDGGRRGQVELAPINLGQFGDRTLAWRFVATIDFPDLDIPINTDFVVVFKGQAVLPMMFLNPGGPFPPDLERSLIEKVVARA